MKYLNRRQKQIITHLAAFHSAFEEIIENWEELERPTDQIKYAKMARTFAMKVMKLMQEDVDQEQINALLREVGKKELVLTYSSKAKKEKKVETEDLYDIINYNVDSNCRDCLIGNKQNCELKQLLIKYNIPVVNDEKIERCPYKI